MREILFRGKPKGKNEWIKGNLLFYPDVNRAYMSLGVFKGGTFLEVQKDTVGQYTGLTDKNGKKIFEGDIVKKSWTSTYNVGNQRRSQINTFIGQIVFKSGSYRMKEQGEFIGTSHNGEWLEVIGNIHDNPELLEEGAE